MLPNKFCQLAGYTEASLTSLSVRQSVITHITYSNISHGQHSDERGQKNITHPTCRGCMTFTYHIWLIWHWRWYQVQRCYLVANSNISANRTSFWWEATSSHVLTQFLIVTSGTYVLAALLWQWVCQCRTGWTISESASGNPITHSLTHSLNRSTKWQ